MLSSSFWKERIFDYFTLPCGRLRFTEKLILSAFFRFSWAVVAEKSGPERDVLFRNMSSSPTGELSYIDKDGTDLLILFCCKNIDLPVRYGRKFLSLLCSLPISGGTLVLLVEETVF